MSHDALAYQKDREWCCDWPFGGDYGVPLRGRRNPELFFIVRKFPRLV